MGEAHTFVFNQKMWLSASLPINAPNSPLKVIIAWNFQYCESNQNVRSIVKLFHCLRLGTDCGIGESREDSMILFAMQLALASMSSIQGAIHSFDDLLMAFQALESAYGYNHAVFHQRLLMELLQALKFSLDQASNEASEKIIRNAMLQRLLSIQAAIGLPGYIPESRSGSSYIEHEPLLFEPHQRPDSVLSELARTLLNLRHVSAIFLYLYATSRGPAGQEAATTVSSGK